MIHQSLLDLSRLASIWYVKAGSEKLRRLYQKGILTDAELVEAIAYELIVG